VDAARSSETLQLLRMEAVCSSETILAIYGNMHFYPEDGGNMAPRKKCIYIYIYIERERERERE
jgi:hypothetical protein